MLNASNYDLVYSNCWSKLLFFYWNNDDSFLNFLNYPSIFSILSYFSDIILVFRLNS
jgi:hypothetical protein